MARLPLNQTSLHSQSKRLAAFEKFLPSVDLKRRQLIAERNKAIKVLDRRREQLETVMSRVAEELPMLTGGPEDLNSLIKVAGVDIVEENLMGVRLPVLKKVSFDRRPYALLARPHWIDRLVDFLVDAMELQLQCQVDEERLRILEDAVRKSTQRFNLFDKVLIPRTRANIRQIQLFLSDQSTAAVVRAKIAKTRVERGS
ncbi:MAG: V-type ATP synthase subunit D [Gammaproteobacteria bacterium]|nr:V-type ATP synthase subunit D [Gammaproteobacteria bacterium]MBT8445240.1 V-type ATP synthase subunit D [Gammaproteobacteria bacterium]NND36778.1 V-type ATP synthase subunit D [Gammaproteobacteria bacterium]